MSELEKVARAICSASCGTPDALDYDGRARHWANHLPEARAALLAIREPTRALVEKAVGPLCDTVPYNPDPTEGFTAVIDAILNETRRQGDFHHPAAASRIGTDGERVVGRPVPQESDAPSPATPNLLKKWSE